MSPYVKKLVEETGEDEKKVSEVWKKAKSITRQDLGIDEDSFTKKEHFEYALDVARSHLGLDEKTVDPTSFLSSEKSAEEYIETVVSADFTIGNVWPAEKEDHVSAEGEDDIEYETRDEDPKEQGEMDFPESPGEVISDAEVAEHINQIVETDDESF